MAASRRNCPARRHSLWSKEWQSWTLPWTSAALLRTVSKFLFLFFLFLYSFSLDAQAKYKAACDTCSALESVVQNLHAAEELVSKLEEWFTTDFSEFAAAMSDPQLVLKSLSTNSGDVPIARFLYQHCAFLASVFNWNSPLNFSSIDNRDLSLLEWLKKVKAELANPSTSDANAAGLSGSNTHVNVREVDQLFDNDVQVKGKAGGATGKAATEASSSWACSETSGALWGYFSLYFLFFIFYLHLCTHQTLLLS